MKDLNTSSEAWLIAWATAFFYGAPKWLWIFCAAAFVADAALKALERYIETQEKKFGIRR